MGICSQLLELIKDNQRSRNVHLKRPYRGLPGRSLQSLYTWISVC